MIKNYLLPLSFFLSTIISCDLLEEDLEVVFTFLEVNDGIMWQSTDEYYEDLYLGFSNNIDQEMVYFVDTDDDYGYCISYKNGRNIIPGSECDWENGNTIQTFSIVTNTENLLVLDFSYYDDSCDSPFTIDYRYSYSKDGDYLYETIEQIGQESEFNEYSMSFYSFNELCL